MIFLVSCVRPLVSHVRPNVRPWTPNLFVSFLSSIDLYVTTIPCPMLRPLSCLTMFCDHNFSLACMFNLQFSQNYINTDTDEIQHWFCYFVQSLWNKNTIYERSNGRTFYHIFTPYTNTFFFLFHIVLYTIMWSRYNLCTHGCMHTYLNTKWRLLFKKMTSEDVTKILCLVKVIIKPFYLVFICFQLLFLHLHHIIWLFSLLFKRLWQSIETYAMI